MSLPHIAVASLGGTITMTPGTTGAGVTPTLGADDLIAAVPGLQRIASIETATLASLPGASLSFADVLSALDWAEAAVARGAHGVVLIQGTDTLEETAYLLDLHWSRPEPLVVTGAMRSPGVPGADGHANLLASVQTAASSPCGPLGAVVVMNDEVHAASRARKSHAASTAAFVSPVFGPIGVVSEGRVVYSNRPSRRTQLDRPPPGVYPRVAMIDASLGDDGTLLRLARSDGYGGAVISAFGAGHVPFDLAAAISEAIGTAIDDTGTAMTVVFASRTGAGSTLRHTYAFTGSESDLIARGALPAGWLDPYKARVLLWSLLAAGASPQRIRDEFVRRGGTPHDHD